MIAARYQFVALGPEGSPAAQLLRTIETRLTELGLSPDAEVTLSRSIKDLDLQRSPTVAAFFGGVERRADLDAAAESLTRSGIMVLPVVDDLSAFRRKVPACLLPINGMQITPEDKGLDAIAARLLEELRLVRAKRLVFVSYRRDEAAETAQQLYRAFDARGFDVFLDTHSVRCGVEFQSVLWDRLADADLLLLLDSPNALSSRWVEAELVRAEALGLGVLQVVWPGHGRRPGTDFCDAFFLEADHFASAGSALEDTIAAQIVTRAEQLRARSLAARRSRLVLELARRASSMGARLDVHPGGCVDVVSAGGTSRRVFPLTGHPESLYLEQCAGECSDKKDGVVLYDGLGILPAKASHLGWLNRFLPLKAVSLAELPAWLRQAAS